MNHNYDPKPRFFNIGVQPVIGENCSLVDVLLDCSALITIEDDVAFGHGVSLLTAKHDYTKFGKERMETSICLPITIKEGAWIASGAIICQGVTIGENAVVAAGSVITRDVPDYEVWGGVPGRFIKEIKH